MTETAMAAAVRLIARYPLAWVISRELDASPLPLLAEVDGAGAIAALSGHCGKTNPLAAAFGRDPRGIILFDGPSGYVSPMLVERPDWAPTWNFASLRFEVEVELVPAETAASLEEMLDHMEGPIENGRWTVDRMGDRFARLLDRIVAFRAHVTRFDARFKLGQDERDAEFAQIVARHPDRTLVEWMTALADRPASPS